MGLAIDSETGGSAEVHKQMQSLEQAGSPGALPYQQMTDSQVAHARLTKHGHRPLGRTQSAPLPLGHPMLTSTNVSNALNAPQRYEDVRTQHNFLKQVRTPLIPLIKVLLILLLNYFEAVF